MASARAMIERRRASRISTRIPVTIFPSGAAGQPLRDPAEAIGVSRCGALVRAPFLPALGSRIELQNGFSQETREFRVVRVSAPKKDGLFELGIEILNPAHNFWGLQFPDERALD